jgi:protein-tyrosine phosphatase
MQVTAGSLHGTFGPNCQKMAHWMVEHRLVHFVATDAHSPKARRPLLRRAFDVVERLMDRETAVQVCCTNPAAVVAGKKVGIPAPITPRRGGFSWFPWRRAA